MRITGLPDDEQRLLDGLLAVLKAKRTRNVLRDNLMDGKKTLDRYGLIHGVPENLGIVVGWPAKAVETLARRCNLTGFTSTGDLDALGVTDILDANQYFREAPQGHVSSLAHSCAFQVVTKGLADEPDVLITRTSARDSTGEWDARLRRLVSYVSVIEYGDQGEPVDLNFYLPDRAYVIRGKAVQEVPRNPLGVVPVEPLVYKPRLGRPFGSSRISRAVIFLTQSAMRVVLRSEGTADLYSAPGLIALGLTADQLQQGAWLQGLGNVVGIPDADSAPSDALARAQVLTIQQASQEPHVTQLKAWAQLFAGETSIPVSSLGLSIDQANPTSAEAYAASREDLIAEAEDAGREWGAAHARTVKMAWALREGVSLDDLPTEMRSLRAKWRDPRHVSQAAAADAFVKSVGALPWLADTDEALEMLGLDDDMVARLKAARRRSQARSTILALTGGTDAVSG